MFVAFIFNRTLSFNLFVYKQFNDIQFDIISKTNKQSEINSFYTCHNMTSVYILKLKNNKYFVGRTSKTSYELQKSIKYDTLNGLHTYEWLLVHEPIFLYDVIMDCKENDEEKYTIQYMQQFGIDNVRGSKYKDVILSDNTVKNIISKIHDSERFCIHCKKTMRFYFICECTFKSQWECSLCDATFDSHGKAKHHEKYVHSIHHDGKYNYVNTLGFRC